MLTRKVIVLFSFRKKESGAVYPLQDIDFVFPEVSSQVSDKPLHSTLGLWLE